MMRPVLEACAYALYKTPHSTHFTSLVQHTPPALYTSLAELPLSGGYVIAPFEAEAGTPVCLIEPEEVETHALPLPEPGRPRHTACTDDEALQRTRYAQSFSQMHARLLSGELQKAVLSRRLNLHLTAPGEQLDAWQLFLRACHYRPNSFVALWSTPATGSWLVATPEPLLEKRHGLWGTVALAGTLPWAEGVQPQWDAKNREEQAIVARFIREQLEQVTDTVQLSETYSLPTGNIQHLCTDFSFSLDSETQIRQALLRLHPTPAVCGLPREAARRAIRHDEPTPRGYYAGFSGPLNLAGETHLYVSLRCMAFTPRHATLYAGGGIMPASREADEWTETQRKMQTMRQLF